MIVTFRSSTRRRDATARPPAFGGGAGRPRARGADLSDAARARPQRRARYAGAGDLLRALAAPVRIAIVLELRRGVVLRPRPRRRARPCRSPWSASTCACSRRPASCTVSGGGARSSTRWSTTTSRTSSSTPSPTRRRPRMTRRALRATRQRAAVSGLLDRLADFRSAQEIHEELRRVGEGIGLTTVYRTLQALADAGEVDVLRTDSGEIRLPAVRHRRPPPPSGVPAVRQAPWRSRGRRWRRGPSGSRTSTASPTSATPSRSSGCAATVALRSLSSCQVRIRPVVPPGTDAGELGRGRAVHVASVQASAISTKAGATSSSPATVAYSSDPIALLPLVPIFVARLRTSHPARPRRALAFPTCGRERRRRQRRGTATRCAGSTAARPSELAELAGGLRRPAVHAALLRAPGRRRSRRPDAGPRAGRGPVDRRAGGVRAVLLGPGQGAHRGRPRRAAARRRRHRLPPAPC